MIKFRTKIQNTITALITVAVLVFFALLMEWALIALKINMGWM